MKAVQYHNYGDASVLRYEDVPMPEIGADDVLIKVHSAAINPADTQFRRGDYKDFSPRPLPFILGWDVAGTVEKCGPLVTRFKPGDAVFSMADMTRNGAYAEYIAVRADEVVPAPRSIPPQVAAGVPLAALTAWKALFDDGRLRAGQRVLVLAASGGVGMFAAQLARLAGAHVIGTASAANQAMLKDLGIHEPIDYQKTDVGKTVKDVDIVIDGVGGATRENAWACLRKGGLMAAIAMPPPDAAAAERFGVRATMVQVLPNGARLESLGQLIDTGRLKVFIDREYPLAEAQAAHQRSESRRARGKIILRVA